MAALQYVDVPGYAALILRRTMPQLRGPSGLLARAMQWLAQTDAVWNERESTWKFPSGAALRFGHMEHENNKFDYDGQEYQLVCFDELTHFTETQYDWVGFSRTRRTLDIDVPIRTRGSATPTGVGYGWVKRRFITNRKPDVVFVPANVYDNPGISVPEYVASLSQMPVEQRKKLLEGDWDVNDGAAYPHFAESVHVIPPIDIPPVWSRFEGLDFGVRNPTCWLACGVGFSGEIVVYDEYYSEGLISEHAAAIKLRRDQWYGPEAQPSHHPSWLDAPDRGMQAGWSVWGAPRADIVGSGVVCYADPSIRNRTGSETKWGEPASTLTEFRDLGLHLVMANNDRRAGFNRVNELLVQSADRVFPDWHERAGEFGAPGIYFVGKRCPNLVEQLRAAPLEGEGKPLYGEAVHGVWESTDGHAHAALRYATLSRPAASERRPKVPETEEELRTAKLREWDHPLDLDDEPSGFVSV